MSAFKTSVRSSSLIWGRRRSSPSASNPFPWLFPTALILGVFYLLPMLDAIRLAFTDASLASTTNAALAEEGYTVRNVLSTILALVKGGAGEYEYTWRTITATLSSEELPGILGVTAIFTVLSVLGQQALGLGVALLVVRGERRGLWGMTTLRTVILVAWVVPGVANGVIWQMLFSEAPYGAINGMLRGIGMSPVEWLSNPTVALCAASISNIWRGTAFSMVLCYAALKSLDPTLLEAADVDGAKPFQKFCHVTLPQMRPVILVNMILISIATLNTFDAIIALTGGGPGRATEVISLYSYNTVFNQYDLAGGSVLSLLMMVISLILTFVYLRFLPREENSR